jgi:hypothetical protein
MSSLGYSEFNAGTNEPDQLRRNGREPPPPATYIESKKQRNRTLKVKGSASAASATTPGIEHENGDNTLIASANNKLKQMKDYIENIHKKGGYESDDDDGFNVYAPELPTYPAQGMGVNVTKNYVIPGPNDGAGSGPLSPNGSGISGVKHTTQQVSLHPDSSYSSTLLDGSALRQGFIGEPEKPHGSNAASAYEAPSTTSAYAKQYYEQFVPYMESSNLAANHLGGNNAALVEKLNYIIHMLEAQQDEKTGNVMEELVLYCFLGVFIIFVVDSFARSGKYVR